MATQDKTEYALSTAKMRPRARRAVATPHYSLPRPYRRKAFAEEAPSVSKIKVAVLVLAGVMSAGLIIELVALAKENERVRNLPIIAAATPAVAPAAPPLAPLMRQEPRPAPPVPYVTLTEPVSAAIIAPVTPPDTIISHPPEQTDVANTRPAAAAATLAPPLAPRLSRAVVLAAARKTHQPAPLAAFAAAEPDPDVVLITAILLLAPHVRADIPGNPGMCTPGSRQETSCAAPHGMRP